MKIRGEMKTLMILMSALLLSVVFGFLVSAIGVGFAQIVEVTPGQTVDKFLSLQNLPAGDGDLIFTWTIQEGSNVVSFPGGNDFEVGDGEIRQVKLRVRLDQSVPLGSSVPVRILFSTAPSSDGEERTVQVSPGIGFNFDVMAVEEQLEPVSEESDDSGGNMLFWFLALIVLVVVVWFVWKKMKK